MTQTEVDFKNKEVWRIGREQSGERRVLPSAFFVYWIATLTDNFVIGKNVTLKYEEERLLLMLIYILSCLEKLIFTLPEF